MTTISGRSLASYRMMLKETAGLSRMSHDPAASKRAYYDSFPCPACVANANRKQYRVVFTTGSWSWAHNSAIVKNVEDGLRQIPRLSVEQEWQVLSMIDIIQYIEVYDIEENRVIATFKDGQKIMEKCPICFGTGRQLFHVHVPARMASGHGKLLKGYVEVSDLAEIMGLPTLEKYLDRDKTLSRVVPAARDWFVKNHLGDLAVTSRNNLGKVWYECPLCDQNDPYFHCHLCSGTGEAGWDDILEHYSDEFVYAVQDDPTSPYQLAYDEIVRRLFRTEVLYGSGMALISRPNGQLQIVSEDWGKAYAWAFRHSIPPTPPHGTNRQRVMWLLHTDSLAISGQHMRSLFYYDWAEAKEGIRI